MEGPHSLSGTGTKAHSVSFGGDVVVVAMIHKSSHNQDNQVNLDNNINSGDNRRDGSKCSNDKSNNDKDDKSNKGDKGDNNSLTCVGACSGDPGALVPLPPP